MPIYLCRPAELNSSSPVLPEGAHSLEHKCLELSEDSENLRGRGGAGRRDKEIDGTRGEGGTEREREREGERERESERERKRGGKLHGHTRTFTDNLTCMLLVRLWMRIKELVPVQQTS